MVAVSEAGYSLEGFVFGADVETDYSPIEDEGVLGVMLHQHLCILHSCQLNKRLDTQTNTKAAIIQTYFTLSQAILSPI